MKIISLNTISVLIATLLAIVPFQAKADSNSSLAALMRGLMKDQSVVTAPLKAANLTDVNENMIRDAILRARVVRYLVRDFSGGMGAIKDGNFVAGEYTPASIAKLAGATQSDALAKATDILNQLVSKYEKIEASYLVELPKAAADRDFTVIKNTMTEIQNLMKEGHTLFKG